MKDTEKKCRVCGCTQMHACAGGCYWVEDDLCSQCAVCDICGNTGQDYDITKCEGCGKLFCDHCGHRFEESNFCNECVAKMKEYDCSECKTPEEDCPLGREYSTCYECQDFQKASQIDILIREAHQNAVDHGWWEKPKTFGELIALCHSELSEALEEFRNGMDPTETYYTGKTKPYLQMGSTAVSILSAENKRTDFSLTGEEVLIDKPEGIPSELADVVIRVFDMCGYYGIDLDAAIKEKMEYNKTRPYKHGGKKI